MKHIKFFKENKVEELKSVHRFLKDLIDSGDFKSVNDYLNSLCDDEDFDIGKARMALIITKCLPYFTKSRSKLVANMEKKLGREIN